jgi:hypothetical protein
VELAGRYSTAKPRIGLPAAACVTMLPAMFVVSEEATAAIRAMFATAACGGLSDHPPASFAGVGPVNQTMIRPSDRRWCEAVH